MSENHNLLIPGKPENEIEEIKELFLPTHEIIIQSMRKLGLGETKIQTCPRSISLVS